MRLCPGVVNSAVTTIRFSLNGSPFEAQGVDPHTPLLHLLREHGLTGTKEGCAEGECGACAVVMVRPGPDGKARYTPINSCLVLAPAVQDTELWTVEGVAPKDAEAELHPVQEAMVRLGGSQCGFCTPGFIMSLFAEHYREDRKAGEVDIEALGGNLCRCTGYRPIQEALASLPAAGDDQHKRRLEQAPPAATKVDYEAAGVRFCRATNLAEALEYRSAHPEAKIIGGGTDIVVEVNQLDRRWDNFLALDSVAELRRFEDNDDELIIGAGVPLSEIEERHLPLFDELLPLFSSRLIRNRATLGGNIGNASPIGDSPPALLALDADIVLASTKGERRLPLANFFQGYKQTELATDELIVRFHIPKPLPDLHRFYKVSKRIMDDISTVAAGFGLWIEDGVITKARLAYGGVAATPVRAKAAEDALVGKPWNSEAADAVAPLLESAFTPLTDHRGSAAYRKAMVPSLLRKLAAEGAAR